jgi:thioredoxin 1
MDASNAFRYQNFMGVSVKKKSVVALFFVFLITLGGSLDVRADRYRYPLGDISRAELFERHEVFSKNYEDFEAPAMIDGLPEDLEVQILFGTWCHDSEREVPRVLKLLGSWGVEAQNISLIALDIRKEEPEGRARALGVRYTPTFIFLSGGSELGRIIERPKVSLQDDIERMLVK